MAGFGEGAGIGAEDRRLTSLSDPIGSEHQESRRNADPTRADYGFGLGLAVRATPAWCE